MELTNEDLEIIKKFIDYCEMVIDLYEKYNSQKIEVKEKRGKIYYLTRIDDLENKPNETNNYIEELYNEIYSGTLESYFEASEEIEPPTRVYNPKETLPKKDYYCNIQTTISKIYGRLKYLYEFYHENNNLKNFLDIEELQKKEEFYKKFKHAICEYNNSNIERISILETLQNKNASQKTK